MKKSFCDICEVELIKENEMPSQTKLSYKSKNPFATIQLNAAFDVCKYCVIDAVKQMDNRPTQGE